MARRSSARSAPGPCSPARWWPSAAGRPRSSSPTGSRPSSTPPSSRRAPTSRSRCVTSPTSTWSCSAAGWTGRRGRSSAPRPSRRSRRCGPTCCSSARARSTPSSGSRCASARRRRSCVRSPSARGKVVVLATAEKLGTAAPHVVVRAHRHDRQRCLRRGARALRAGRNRGRPPVNLTRATRAVYAVFILSGFAFASWASRIPQVRDSLELSPRQLGLVLLAMAIGSVISMPLAGLVVSRLGAARTITVMALIAAAGLVTAGIGQSVSVLPVVIGLFLFGVGNGTWDVAMNVEGSAVEQRLGKAIMPRFHAGFSVGTVAGALIGAGDGRAGRLPHGAPDRDRGARRGRRSARRARLPRRRAHRGDRAARKPAQGLDRAAHAADRRVRVRRRVHRGHRQRLAGRRDHRRLRRAGRARVAHVRALPRRDDARPLVRPGGARPLRPCADAARALPHRARRARARRLGRFAARGDGGRDPVGRWAPRSGSRSG